MKNFVNILFLLGLTYTVIYGDWIREKSDHDIIDRDDDYWYIKVRRAVNRPPFPAYIRFFNTHTAKNEYSIDCSRSPQVLYHQALSEIIFLTKGHFWSEGDSYYITLDAGVLFSTDSENSTAYKNPKFWRFTVIAPYFHP